jgi:chaperonin cofactor prefoldin
MSSSKGGSVTNFDRELWQAELRRVEDVLKIREETIHLRLTRLEQRIKQDHDEIRELRALVDRLAHALASLSPVI